MLIFKQGEDLWSDLARRDRRRAGSDQGDPRSRPGALGLMRSLEAVDEEVGEFPDYAIGVHTDRASREYILFLRNHFIKWPDFFCC